MRQIIHFQAGQCGNQIGMKFWQAICDQHHIDQRGIVAADKINREQLNVYFNENLGNTWAPRSIFFDLDSGPIDAIRACPFGKLFRTENFLYSTGGASNNWCKGHYSEGFDMIDTVTDAARRQVQNCDMLQGFQLTHSIGGGTGSGMGTLLVGRLRQMFPTGFIQTYTIMPSQKVSDTVVEPYNAVLALHQLIENADSVMTIDNQALYNICTQFFKHSTPTYGDLNHLAKDAMAGVTSSYRLPGPLSCDMKKLNIILVPYPRLHFFTLSYAPLYPRGCYWTKGYSSQQISQQVTSRRNMLCDVDPRQGRCISGTALFQGRGGQTENVSKAMNKALNENPYRCFEWISDSIKTSACSPANLRERVAATLVLNTTAIQNIFKRIGEQFTHMYRRKAFVHWYTGEGMDQMEFTEAESNVNDLVSEYQGGQVTADVQDSVEEEA